MVLKKHVLSVHTDQMGNGLRTLAGKIQLWDMAAVTVGQNEGQESRERGAQGPPLPEG